MAPFARFAWGVKVSYGEVQVMNPVLQDGGPRAQPAATVSRGSCHLLPIQAQCLTCCASWVYAMEKPVLL